ncbi:MAG: multidrug efflux SMR transporter [Rhodobacteraceae bacterium]|nr:multidrug efflux SMR transporter [Paracoccaceae bacterium]
MPKQYLFLLIAVVFETVGTTNLQASQQFTRLWPTVFAAIGFGGALYFMGLTLKYMPVGIVYALWSGLGIVIITAIGFVVYKQALDIWALVGMAMIIAGIAVIHLLSGSATH